MNIAETVKVHLSEVSWPEDSVKQGWFYLYRHSFLNPSKTKISPMFCPCVLNCLKKGIENLENKIKRELMPI
ncbi:hypothetical protein BCT75_10000 [Vibrio lentus]|nr:hypothetical protein BCT75_10000 [Vibrio lentus]